MSTHQSQTLDTSAIALLKVAVPVSLGYFIQFFVVFIDNLFLAQIDGNAMSASAYTGLIFVTIAMLGIGMSNGTQILIARRHAIGEFSKVGEILSNSLIIGFILSCFQFVCLFYFVPWFAQHFIDIPELAHYMTHFSRYRSFGFFFFTLTLSLNAYWSGTARTQVLFVSTAVTAISTIILDYFLIFGHGGCPAMGVEGAALANTIADGFAMVVVAYFTFRKTKTEGSFATNPLHQLRENVLKLNVSYSKSLFQLGGPIAFQLLISLGIWAIFYQFVTSMGEGPLQASFIVRNMYMLAYVSVSGFSTTTKTYVSALIAQGKQMDLVPTIKRIAMLNLAGIVLLCHGLILYPEWIASQFTQDANVIVQTVQTMYVVFPAMLVFAITSILLATVEGSGKTMAGFMIEFFTVLIYIVAAYQMIHVFHWPIQKAWTADYVYFSFLGLFSFLYLRHSNWKHNQI
jgi:multidrug resistance protein, MATE family